MIPGAIDEAAVRKHFMRWFTPLAQSCAFGAADEQIVAEEELRVRLMQIDGSGCAWTAVRFALQLARDGAISKAYYKRTCKELFLRPTVQFNENSPTIIADGVQAKQVGTQHRGRDAGKAKGDGKQA